MAPKCNMYNCNGNYPGQPYSPYTTFPSKETEPEERERSILACPTDHVRLRGLAEIYACKSHFERFIKTRGGSRPDGPPAIFPGVPKSCCNQTVPAPRTTKTATVEARGEQQKKNDDKKDKIGSFQQFVNSVKKRYKNLKILHNGDDLTISATDKLGREVVQFLHFKHVRSSFGFLFLERAEKNGYTVSKSSFELQKNSLVSRWSQIDNILSVVRCFEPSNED